MYNLQTHVLFKFGLVLHGDNETMNDQEVVPPRVSVIYGPLSFSSMIVVYIYCANPLAYSSFNHRYCQMYLKKWSLELLMLQSLTLNLNC